MANDEPMPKWRNFLAWGAVGALGYVLAAWGGISILHEEGLGAVLRSREAVAMLGLCMIFATAVVGFGGRKQLLSSRNLRNFVIRDAAAIATFLFLLWGFSTLARAGALGTMGMSEWVAVGTGSALVAIALLGLLATASARAGADFIDDEMAVDDMRERGRLVVYSFVWTAACGLLLIVLGIARPGSALSPAAALAGALVLIGVLAALGIAVWRLSDELARTLSHEAGSIAFYLILALGGGWAMLAHLGFVAGPAPIDWLTLFTVLMFAASIAAAARRKLLAR